MAAISIAVRLLALLMMYKISNPKILNLVSAEEAQTLKMRKLTEFDTKVAPKTENGL